MMNFSKIKSKLKYKIRSLKNKFLFLSVIGSPFKMFKIDFYFGDINIGVPYFKPRRLYRVNGINKYIDIKYFGIDFCGLGWKTKWDEYRFEWNPMLSIVFLGKQIVLTFKPDNDIHYWESFLYYIKETDKNKTKIERVIQCIEECPNTWISNNIKTNYYNLILKKKYLKYIKI